MSNTAGKSAEPRHEVMLDLETMGAGPDAAICAIGAYRVEVWPDPRVLDSFYVDVDLCDAVKLGGQIEPETVLWWMQQEEAARKELYSEGGWLMLDALGMFSEWFGPDKPLWGNGSDFDNVILRRTYQRANDKGFAIAAPWGFRNNRCFRTLKMLYPWVAAPARGEHEIAHTALGDAQWQARYLLVLLEAANAK